MRQIAKDVTVRVSEPWSGSKQQPLSLCSIASTLGLLVTATSRGLALYDLSQLRETFKKGERNTVPTPPSLHTFDTEVNVQHVTFADHDARLLCALVNGNILAWETSSLRSGFSAPLMVGPPEGNSHLLALEPNPGDRSTLCLAVYGPELTTASGGTAYILDLSHSVWSAPLPCDGVTAVNWSTRGKQFVAGCRSGEIVQLTPEGEIKAKLPPPPEINSPLYVDDVQWLENHVFLITYNTMPAVADDPSHEYELYVLLRDAKSDHLTYASLPLDVAPPFGDTTWWGKRYTAALRTWAGTKHLIFMGCTASTDVGVISCDESSGPSAWNALELEETSRIVLPFSSQDDSSDTAPLGIALDLTATEPVFDPNAAAKGEDPSSTLPPMPILFIYTSDGVLLGYHIINTEARDIYTGMLSQTPNGVEASSSTAAAAPATKSMGTISTPAFGSSSDASKTSNVPAFGSMTAFGNAAGHGKPAFGTTSAFGTASSSTPAFGATSSFGSSPFTSSAAFGKPSFGSASQSSGFGAFGGSTSAFSKVPSKLSTNAFGSGSAQPASGPPNSAFGGNSGFSNSTKSAFSGNAFSSAASKPSAFGSVASQGNVFGSGGSFNTSQVPVFGQHTPKAVPETPKNEITSNEAPPKEDTPVDKTFTFGELDNILGREEQGKEENQEQDMLEDPAHNGDDVSENDVQNVEPEQSDTSEPIVSGNPQDVPRLRNVNDDIATKLDENEKSPSASNNAKEDKNPPTMESSTPPTKQGADTATVGLSSQLEEPKDAKFSLVQHTECKPSTDSDVIGLTQDQASTGLRPKNSNGKDDEIQTAIPSSSLRKAEPSQGGISSTPASLTNSLEDASRPTQDFSSSRQADAPVNSVEESTAVPGNKLNEALDSHSKPVKATLKPETEKAPSLFSQANRDQSSIAPAFSFSTHSNEKPGFTFAKPVEEPVGLQSTDLALSDKTSLEQASKQEATSAPLPLTSNSINGQVPESSTHASGTIPSAHNDSSNGPSVSSAFGTSASQGFFTKATTSGIAPAFSALTGNTDKQPLLQENHSMQSRNKQEGQPCPSVVNAKKEEPTGVRLTTPVPQIDLSQSIVPSVPKQGDELLTEFIKIYVTLKEELDVLKGHANSCSEFCTKLAQPSSSPKGVDDLKDTESWVFADIGVLGPIARDLTQQLQKGVYDASTIQQRLDGLDSTQLKSEIKKDEIARFLRARQDPEFAKLVRIRHLGPEHVENQWRLRRLTHMVRERMQELQEFLNTVHRNNSLAKQGLSTMRAPSLDSIHRSADNITRIVMMRLSELERIEQELSTLFADLPQEQSQLKSIPRPLDSITDLDVALPSVDHPQPEQMNPMAYSAAEALLSFRIEPLLTIAGETKRETASHTVEQGVIELRQVRQLMRPPQPEHATLEASDPETKPAKITNFLATSTPQGINYGASDTSPGKSLKSAFQTTTLPLLTSSNSLLGSVASLPQQYTTFEGLVQPRPMESEHKDLTLEEFVAQEDELDEEEDDDYEDDDDSDGYDDYEEEDFGDQGD